MRTKPIVDGVAVIFVVTTWLLSICNGQPQFHSHLHGQVRVRLMEKPMAGSSNPSSVLLKESGSINVLPTHTEAAVENRCIGHDCDLLDMLPDLEALARVELGPNADLNIPKLQSPRAKFTGPSRFRFQSTRAFGGHGLSTGGEQASFSENLASMKLSSTIPLTTPVLPATLPTGIEDALIDTVNNKAGAQQHPVYDTPGYDHHPNIVLPRQDNGYESFVLGGFATPTASATASGATLTSVCPASNGTICTSAAGIDYQIICNVDYPDNDYPFQAVDSFEGCLQKCDAYNYDNHHVQCLAALFVPSRRGDANDCYLKHSIAYPIVAALPIHGAIRVGYATTSTSLSSSATTESVTASGGDQGDSPSRTSTSSITPSTTSSTSIATPPSESIVSSPGVTYASGSTVVTPNVAGSQLQGPTQNVPTKQYLNIEAPAGVELSTDLLTKGVNSDITTGYSLSPDTGILQLNSSTQSYLSPITDTPHLSRDGGKGGMLNGEHLFIFCDTGSYSTTTTTTNGTFLGFVSSSVAIDVGMNGLVGDALHLQDGIGEWSDNVGRMRGFAPLTEGELAYNLAMQGHGQRYAVWPESSIIPLDATTGLIYAPIVYDDVNEETRAAVFTYAGTTLLTITADGKGGPIAQRPVSKIFEQDEVEWGCIGGIRSWGASGVGADDGYVYLFGNVAGGILVARVAPVSVNDRNSFEYWNGSAWTSEMPDSSSKAYFIEGSFMDADVFYSPRHLTFIIVYLNSYADSTFYYRFLKAEKAVLPPYAPGGDSSSDYVENILNYSWSDQQVLYKASPGLNGKYIYSGGVHLGYYGSDDILNGGSKMLLSWTAPTSLDPSTLTSEYQIPTAEITWV